MITEIEIELDEVVKETKVFVLLHSKFYIFPVKTTTGWKIFKRIMAVVEFSVSEYHHHEHVKTYHMDTEGYTFFKLQHTIDEYTKNDI